MDWKIHIRRILVQLGEDATFTHGAGTPATVRGIFVSPYHEISLAGAVIAGSSSRFVVMTEDVPNVAIDDTLMRGSVSYKIKCPESDDPGGYTVLGLEKQ